MASLTADAATMEHTRAFHQPSMSDPCSRYLTDYAQGVADGRVHPARQGLLEALAVASERDWLECGRRLVLQTDYETAHAVFAQGATSYPQSSELRLALAGICWQTGQPDQAETQLRDLLTQSPTHAAAAFLLARILIEQGRLRAAADTLRGLFEHARQEADTVIQAVELLDDAQRPRDAAAICEAEIAAGSTDPRIHAYAGMLGIQLGQFDRVRERYDFVLAHSPQALEWNILIGLSGLQRYRDENHPDFQLFRDALQRPDLSEKVRCQTLFALGKAHDDIADYARAVQYFRQANAIAHTRSTWSRKHWRRIIEARLAAKPLPFRLAAPTNWTPVFIVGVPRSGTTLLAELLARHPAVCNRGELGWLATLAGQLAQADPRAPAAFEQAAAVYAAQLRQDDSDAHWLIDKQPLNLLHVGLILTLWPNARIIHCRRSPRDTALSLWTQSFHDQAHDYAYDFGDIAAVIQGSERLMAHWRTCHAASIHTVWYEELVTQPSDCLARLALWLALPELDFLGFRDEDRAISTASAWQARQPVYAYAIERWKGYLPHLSELLKFNATK
jgi:Flp pilus assembly protein TadD